jgi:hypothetical protein
MAAAAGEVRRGLAAKGPVAVLEQPAALPCSEEHPPFRDGDRAADGQESGLDVGRYVVRPLETVAEVADRRVVGAVDKAAFSRIRREAEVRAARLAPP